MRLANIRGHIEKKIVKSDGHPEVVGSLLAGIVTAMRGSTKNPPEGDWQQDKVTLAFAEKFERLKSEYYREITLCWRNRSGLERPKCKKKG